MEGIQRDRINIRVKLMELKDLIAECTAYDYKVELEEKKPSCHGRRDGASGAERHEQDFRLAAHG